MKHLYLLTVLVTLLACSKKQEQSSDQTSYSYSSTEENSEDNETYSNGSYCAQVDYYYSETGTSSTYTLEVDVEDGELVKIHWPNGGWLDNSHFSTPDISDGTARFTSYEGVDYTVRILGKDGDCSLSSYAEDEDDLIADKERREKQEREQVEQDEADQRRMFEELEQEEEEEEQRRQQQIEQEEEEERRQAEEEEDPDN